MSKFRLKKLASAGTRDYKDHSCLVYQKHQGIHVSLKLLRSTASLQRLVHQLIYMVISSWMQSSSFPSQDACAKYVTMLRAHTLNMSQLIPNMLVVECRCYFLLDKCNSIKIEGQNGNPSRLIFLKLHKIWRTKEPSSTFRTYLFCTYRGYVAKVFIIHLKKWQKKT